MKISAVVFDFDGTLVNSNPIKRRTFFEIVSDEPGSAARMRAVLATVRGDRRTILECYVASRNAFGVKGTGADALVSRYSEYVDARVSEAPEMPGASEMLHCLKQAGFQLFVSSTTPQSNLTSIIERRCWRHWFDGLYGYPNQKSDTLRAICARLFVDACSIAVIGDGADDFESAMNMGCRFFPVGEARGVSRGTHVFTLQEVAERLLRPETKIY